MRKCTILFLVANLVWAQTGLDKLILKDGTEYLGKYLRVEEKTVYFKQKEGIAFQPISMKLVAILELKDGRILIDKGMLTKQTTLNFEQYQKLTNEEKAVFVEIKAVYNAKKEARKWNLYLPLSSATFFSLGQIFGAGWVVPQAEDHGVLAYLGFCAASLGLPYYLLKLDRSNIKSVSSEQIKLYEKVFIKEYKKSKLKYFITSFALTGIVGAGLFALTFSLGGGDFGPGLL